jgi:hypothetical protein
MIKVTGFNFTPIHKFRPEKQTFDNDIPGTNSTRLLGTGKQRYVDQLRPESTNYDEEVLSIDSLSLPILPTGLIPLQNNQNTLQQGNGAFSVTSLPNLLIP